LASRADLNLVGPSMRAKRKVIDKIVDGLKFHSRFRASRIASKSGHRLVIKAWRADTSSGF
jgi:hypothetical protein